MRYLILLVLALSTGTALAQCPESHGMFAGLATALSHDRDLRVPLGASTVYVKRQGFLGVAPSAPFAPAGQPDFDLDRMFRLCSATALPDVDALSIGQDWVLADDTTGEVQVPPNRWAALTVSVTRKSRGAPGSRLARELANSDGAAADVFSYILKGSALPPEVISVTERALDSREIDLGRGDQRNVDALDHLIPLYGLDPGAVGATLPPNPTVYFSVTTASLRDVPATWFGNTPPSGATILQATWVRGQWTCPRPYKTFRDLGLAETEDLDGLAVDLLNQRLLFSTTTRTRDPILFLDCKQDMMIPVPYVEGGVPVSTKIGLIEDDDVDGICAMDPSLRSRGNAPNPLFHAIGSPRPRLLPPSGPVSASAFRDYQGGVLRVCSHVVGWPPVTGVGPGLAVAFLSLDFMPNPWLFVGQFARTPVNPPFCGDPHQVCLAIPAVLSLTGRYVDFHWFVADSALTNLGEAHPIRMRL
jgi:hypothetical protein